MLQLGTHMFRSSLYAIWVKMYTHNSIFSTQIVCFVFRYDDDENQLLYRRTNDYKWLIDFFFDFFWLN